MAKYIVPFGKGTASVTQIVEVLSSATVRRIKWLELEWGCLTTPADTQYDFRVQRMTASGTGAAVTPQKADPADAAALSTAEDTCTVDGTFTASEIMLRQALNHRASYRWVAVPGGELVTPAVSANGAGFRLSSASVTDFAGSLMMEEQ